MNKFYVLCRDDTKDDGTQGDYILATRKVFYDYVQAIAYSNGINFAREPLAVKVVWDNDIKQSI